MPLTDEEWERWQKRLLGLILSVVAVAVLVNDLILRALHDLEPSEARVVGALGLLSIPAVLGAAGKIGRGDK